MKNQRLKEYHQIGTLFVYNDTYIDISKPKVEVSFEAIRGEDNKVHLKPGQYPISGSGIGTGFYRRLIHIDPSDEHNWVLTTDPYTWMAISKLRTNGKIQFDAICEITKEGNLHCLLIEANMVLSKTWFQIELILEHKGQTNRYTARLVNAMSQKDEDSLELGHWLSINDLTALIPIIENIGKKGMFKDYK